MNDEDIRKLARILDEAPVPQEDRQLAVCVVEVDCAEVETMVCVVDAR